MDSSDDSSGCCDDAEENGECDCPPFFVGIPESNDERNCEECMSRRERVIYRMRNDRIDPSGNELWGYSPLWNAKIDNSMENECQNNHKKYLECPDPIASVTFSHASEPEKEEKYGSPEYD